VGGKEHIFHSKEGMDTRWNEWQFVEASNLWMAALKSGKIAKRWATIAFQEKEKSLALQ
jgi:hypothetical protein